MSSVAVPRFIGPWQQHRQLPRLSSQLLDVHDCQLCAGAQPYKVQHSHLLTAYQATAPASRVKLQTLHLTALRLLTLQAVRTCPVCRQASWFVTPSSVWPSNPAERLRIIEAYKTRLKTIDCRHFDFGESRCPFGTSCFYKHAYRDGTLEVRCMSWPLAQGCALLISSKHLHLTGLELVY